MIIGISGKIGSGKDTIGKIIQYLTCKSRSDEYLHTLQLDDEIFGTYDTYLKHLYPIHIYISDFKIVKFADKVKDIVCLILGCTREQLEDEIFKNSELGEEWVRYGYADGFSHIYKGAEDKKTVMINEPCSKERYEQEKIVNWQTAYMHKLTPRDILQQIGTDVGRVIHPNVWVNATMREYIQEDAKFIRHTEDKLEEWEDDTYPNWIITDVRFPNEIKTIEDRGGFVIRVERDVECNICGLTKAERRGNTCNEISCPNQFSKHESETALDNNNFNYTINNNGSIKDLIEKVKQILIKEEII